MEQQQQPRKESIFKERAVARDRTFYFDVKETVKGSKYLVINEGRKVGDKYEYSRIMIFENQMKIFSDSFKKVCEFLQIPQEA